MSETLIFSLSGTSSSLESYFFPPIELISAKKYVLGLVELLTFNTIPNIDESNNRLHITGLNPLFIPIGSYEIDDIEQYVIQKLKAHEITFSLKANNNTLKSEIKCSREIDFNQENSIGKLLGFNKRKLVAEKHISNEPVAILSVNSLRVDCNITSGSYVNGKKSHTIHEFFPAVPPGFKIIEIPSQVIYLPITVKTIDYLRISILDQDNNPVNFRGEIITVRLHLKAL